MELILDQALQKGIEAHKAGQTQEADKFYTAVLQSDPKHPDANHNMGVLAVGIGKAQEALPFFKTAVEANSSIVQFWLSYIDALIKLGKIRDAIAVFNQAQDKGIKGEVFDELKQRINELNGNVRDTDLEEGPIGAALNIQDPPHEQLQALINLYGQGQLQQALGQVAVMLEEFPRSLALHNICGASHAGLGKFDAAIESYKKAIKIKPNFANTYYSIGNALKGKGDLDAAIQSYKQALTIKPDFAEACSNMGAALKDKGELDESIKSYKQALKINPGFAEVYYNMAIVLTDKGELYAAIESYKQAIKIKPNYVEAYSNMGAALKDKGELDAAIEICKQAIKIKPDHVEAYNNMGAALKDKGELDAAIEIYKRALQIKPDYADVHYTLGTIFKKLSNFEKHYDHFSRYLELVSLRVETNADIKNIIPKLAKKMVLQNGVPSFFDNAVINQLIGIGDRSDDMCEIYEKSQSSKENRFVAYSNRIGNLPESIIQSRLFNGLPMDVSQGTHSLIKWKEFDIYKTTFDLVLYWMIIEEAKPQVIIELGSGSGGSAIWLADMALALGLETHVYSFDLFKPDINHDRVTFVEYDLEKINGKTLIPYSDEFIGNKLVIEDAHVNLKNVLTAFDNILNKNDYLIVEDSYAKQEIIKNFVNRKDHKYKLDQFYLDFFGTNITCSINSIFKVF